MDAAPAHEPSEARLEALLEAHLPEFIAALAGGLGPTQATGGFGGGADDQLSPTAAPRDSPARLHASPSMPRSFSAVQLHQAGLVDSGGGGVAPRAQHARRASTGTPAAALGCWPDSSCSSSVEQQDGGGGDDVDGSSCASASPRSGAGRPEELASCAASKQQRHLQWLRRQHAPAWPAAAEPQPRGLPLAEGREDGAPAPVSPAGSTGSCPAPPAGDAQAQSPPPRSSRAGSVFARSGSVSGLLQMLRGALGGAPGGRSPREPLQVRVPASSDELDVRDYLACFSPDASPGAAASSSRALSRASSGGSSSAGQAAAAADGWGRPAGGGGSQPGSPRPPAAHGADSRQPSRQPSSHQRGEAGAVAAAPPCSAGAAAHQAASCAAARAPLEPAGHGGWQLPLSPSPTKRAMLLHGPSRLSCQSFRSSSSDGSPAAASGPQPLARCSSPAVLQRAIAPGAEPADSDAPGQGTRAHQPAAAEEPAPAAAAAEAPAPLPSPEQPASAPPAPQQAPQPQPASPAAQRPLFARLAGKQPQRHQRQQQQQQQPVEAPRGRGQHTASQWLLRSGKAAGPKQQQPVHQPPPAAPAAAVGDAAAGSLSGGSSSRSSSPAVAALADGMQRIAGALEEFLCDPRSPSVSPARSLAGSWAAPRQLSPARQPPQRCGDGLAASSHRDQGTQAGPAGAGDAAPCSGGASPTKGARLQQHAAAAGPPAAWSPAAAAAKARMLAANSPSKQRPRDHGARLDAAPADQDGAGGGGSHAWVHPSALTRRAVTTERDQRQPAQQQQQQPRQDSQQQQQQLGQLPRGLRPPPGVHLAAPGPQQQPAAGPPSRRSHHQQQQQQQQQQQHDDVEGRLLQLACRAAGVDLTAAGVAPAAVDAQCKPEHQAQLWLQPSGLVAEPTAPGRAPARTQPAPWQDTGDGSDSSGSSSCGDSAGWAPAAPQQLQRQPQGQLRLLSPTREPRTRKLRLLRQLPLSDGLPDSAAAAGQHARSPDAMLWHAGSGSQPGCAVGSRASAGDDQPTGSRLVRLPAATPRAGVLQPPVLLRPAASSAPPLEARATPKQPVPWQALRWGPANDVQPPGGSLADRAAGAHSLAAGRTAARLLRGGLMAGEGGAAAADQGMPPPAAPLWRPEAAGNAAPADTDASQQAPPRAPTVITAPACSQPAPWHRQPPAPERQQQEQQASAGQQQSRAERRQLRSPAKRGHSSPVKKGGDPGSRRWALLQRLKARHAQACGAPDGAALLAARQGQTEAAAALVQQLQALMQSPAAAGMQTASGLAGAAPDPGAAAPPVQGAAEARHPAPSRSASSSQPFQQQQQAASTLVAAAQTEPAPASVADAAVQAVDAALQPPAPPQQQPPQASREAAEELAQLIVSAFQRAGGRIPPAADAADSDRATLDAWGGAPGLTADGGWGALPDALPSATARPFGAVFDLAAPPHAATWQQQQQQQQQCADWGALGQPSPSGAWRPERAAEACEQQWAAGGSPTTHAPNPGCCFAACHRHMHSPELDSPEQRGQAAAAAATAAAAAAARVSSARRKLPAAGRGRRPAAPAAAASGRARHPQQPQQQQAWTARQSQTLDALQQQWKQQQQQQQGPDEADAPLRLERERLELEGAYARASAARAAARRAARSAAEARGQRLKAELGDLSAMLAEVGALAQQMEAEQADVAAAVEAFAG